MATPILATPVLSGKDASRFVERWKKPPKKEARVDFDRVYENIMKKVSESGKKHF